jgi:MYXO-CTERM domain-containing protein
MKVMLRRSMASLVGLVALMVAPAAFAEGEACFNDTDCPGAECGGEVCNWSKMNATPIGEKKYTCNPAGTQPKGADGWCTTVDNCKCKAQGATCPTVYCSFTKATDAPMTAGGTAAGGSASTAGTTSAGGTTSTAGMSSAGTAATEADSGGCSVASPVSTGGGIALALGMMGLGAAFARRRR